MRFEWPFRNLSEMIVDGERETLRHFIILTWLLFFFLGIIVGVSIVKGGYF